MKHIRCPKGERGGVTTAFVLFIFFCFVPWVKTEMARTVGCLHKYRKSSSVLLPPCISILQCYIEAELGDYFDEGGRREGGMLFPAATHPCEHDVGNETSTQSATFAHSIK